MFDALLERRGGIAEATILVERKRAAVKHQLVLTTYHVAIEHRQASLAHAIAQHLESLRVLVHVIRRSVKRQQCLRAGGKRGLGRTGLPDVSTDAYTQA